LDFGFRRQRSYIRTSNGNFDAAHDTATMSKVGDAAAMSLAGNLARPIRAGNLT
jgi:hypothetical protein